MLNEDLRSRLESKFSPPCATASLLAPLGLVQHHFVARLDGFRILDVVSTPRSPRRGRGLLVRVFRGSPPHLRLSPIRPETPVRRGSNDTVDELLGKHSQHVQDMATEDCRGQVPGDQAGASLSRAAQSLSFLMTLVEGNLLN